MCLQMLACEFLPHPYFRTFAPMNDRERILEKLSEISVELEKDMTEMGWIGRTVTLKYKLDTYQGKITSIFL